MNKLMGFYELNNMNLPSIPWREYSKDVVLDDKLLWTIRSAVYQGNDLNLPRLVGITSFEAKVFADSLLDRLGGNGIVIYYPFFIAKKSGNLNVFSDAVVIEAVKDDLWNLVTHAKVDVTIQINEDGEFQKGNAEFLTEDEKNNLLIYVGEIRKLFRDDLFEGKSILLEWSFAQNSSIDKMPIGKEYLVFYEARTV
ncbi:hypothetical protein [Anaerotignum sp.]|uniref:hypothetical protein n=1 Tax=Anaerotignum sp. TaxID=2039241 RepID=UPI003326A255